MSNSSDLTRRGVLYATTALALAGGTAQANAPTATSQVVVQRFSVTSSKPFETVVAALDAEIGRPNMSDFQTRLGAAKTYAEMEQVVHGGLGRSGLMEFARYDLGAVLRKERPQGVAKSVRFLVGNPLIMKEMVKHVPDAGSYAPVTVLVDERPDGVHLSYDKMASFLAPYGNEAALKVARDLDAKVEGLLAQAAS